MQKAFLLLLVIVFSAFVYAQASEIPPLPPGEKLVEVTLLNSLDASPLAQKTVTATVREADSEFKTLFETDSQGSAELQLGTETEQVVLEIDESATAAPDYLGVAYPLNKTVLKVFMQPVSSVSGQVLFNNRPVPGADVAVTCLKSFYGPAELETATKTGAAGEFLLKHVPTGMCEVIASANGRSGSAKTELAAGEIKSVSIELREVQTELAWPVIAAVLVLIAVFAFFTLRNRPRPKPAEAAAPARKPKHNEAKGRPSAEMEAVLKTLKEDERKVMEHLLANKGRSTQARIYRDLLLPKTTLWRLLHSLENRGLIRATKVGRNKDVRLSEWLEKKK